MSVGISLSLLIGKVKPTKAPRELMEALDSVEVTHNEQGRSGFQISFRVGRSGVKDQQDFNLLKSPLLAPFNRVMIIVNINATAKILMDGIITLKQFSPGELGRSTLNITGEDVSVMMDLEEKSIEHPQQDETKIVRHIVSKYSKYGFDLEVVPPEFQDTPEKTRRTPVQQGTDLKYIQEMASRFDHVFHITAGPTQGRNKAYWGPPKRKTKIQKALTVNMGSYSNVESINFQYSALAPATVDGYVQDRNSNQQTRVLQMFTSDRPNLSAHPALTTQSHRRTTIFRETGRLTAQSLSRAQAIIDNSTEQVVTASGELDVTRYGTILELRGLVGLRGVGLSHDGVYYVKSVTHKLREGEYKQSFTITREGLGSKEMFLQI
ncbi:hypothetical protein G7B40_009185 [Aetokthonos hydrillicola Thurmond2011]|uniref:Uncharacterized protein n=1 Tax=Aetokthonos hydrillicola Thurmond2011 TaxID=2712845 RepID=A0AAP5M4C2_9CYAN|nr:hypothetical protein [Aetokthonos hydrillicola]MBO3457577.1 hypothetical protein [Aetokthonos hydrillicola CCALA 1050]MBW4590910.1 hypothetical protein [Aetokthonos hydrillicola CCALA 1050]MDR9894741.1 hypothetical protein [Aetokthonos hydrillicola Thurmond2011]